MGLIRPLYQALSSLDECHKIPQALKLSRTGLREAIERLPMKSQLVALGLLSEDEDGPDFLRFGV